MSSVRRSSLAMASGSMASRVLGVARQSLITYLIGMALVGNAFQTANTLPNIIYVVIAGGVLNSVLIPQLVKAGEQADGGRDYTDRLLTVALLIFLAVTVVATLAAGPLVRLYSDRLDGPALDLAVFFAVITLPQLFCYALFGLLGQVLNARGRFAMFGWAPALANVVAIAGLGVVWVRHGQSVELGRWTSEMVWLFAGTATLSIAAQALVLLIPLWRSGFRWRPRFGLRGTGLATTSRVTGWAFASLLVSQVAYLVASKVMWNATGPESQRAPGEPFVAGTASYSNALLVFLVPHGLIALSVFTAMYPRISASVHAADWAGLRRDYRRGLTVPAALTVPASVALLVFSVPLMTLLFSSRDPAEIPGTAAVLACLALGVLPLGVDVLNQRVFYAFEDVRTAFTAQVVLTVTALAVTGVAALLRPEWTAATIAIGLVVSNVVAAAYGMVKVRARVGELGLAGIVRSWVRMGLASALAALPAWGLASWIWSSPAGSGRLGALAALAAGGLVMGGLYVALARVMRIREVDDYLGPVLRRLPGLRAR